jgi:hypothetical protein
VWKELVSRHERLATYAEPIFPKELANAERKLRLALPADLRGCLAESNGLTGRQGEGLVWSVERIVEGNLSFRANRTFRELYMPFDHLLFFSDAGNGDQFAYAILAGEVRKDDIYVWNHEDDSRTWVAPRLAQFLEWRLTGIINV